MSRVLLTSWLAQTMTMANWNIILHIHTLAHTYVFVYSYKRLDITSIYREKSLLEKLFDHFNKKISTKMYFG